MFAVGSPLHGLSLPAHATRLSARRGWLASASTRRGRMQLARRTDVRQEGGFLAMVGQRNGMPFVLADPPWLASHVP